MTTPPPTPAPAAAPPDMRSPEQLEAGIVTALRERDIGTSSRLLGLLATRDRERAEAVYDAMMLGTTFAGVPEGRVGSIAVDFDGVIHAYSKGWGDGTIYDRTIPGALAGIWALMQLGSVFVFTARTVYPTTLWLRERHVPAVADVTGDVQFWEDRDRVLVTNRKLPARWYIDDLAVPFTSSWTALLHEVTERWHAMRDPAPTARPVVRPDLGRRRW